MSRKAHDNPPKGDILIVDDMPANLRLLSSMLAEQGFKVRSVISGEMALTAARASLPDLILLDINMPEMNGYQVCEHLKADEQTRDIPVIFISALDEIQDKVKAFTVGGVDYITKPFQLEEVLARVETHLALRDLQKKLQDANRRFEQELALAGQVQASFLPEKVPDIHGWQLSVTLKPARETSGDFYDINPLADDRLAIVIADVVGKGAAAALHMALNWTLIRTYATEYPTQPELVCSAVNRRILVDTHAEMFVTLFYGVLNPATGSLVYCNAGHNPPYLIGGRNGETIQELAGTGVPLGMFEEATWRQSTAQITPGDVLLLYTDGVVEAQNAQEALFGAQHMLKCVQTNLGRPAREIQDAILDDVCEFMDDEPQMDDITLVVLVRDSGN